MASDYEIVVGVVAQYWMLMGLARSGMETVSLPSLS